MTANSLALPGLPRLGPEFSGTKWLARGGQGGVAAASLRGRPVVLKAIDLELALDAQAVFGLLQKLSSPHLPDALELAREGEGRTWLVTSFVEGAPLAVEAVGLPQVLDEAIGVAHALAALHGAGTHHADVSCANVLRTPTGGVVLTDLGALGSKGTGTPGFLAPECLAGGGGPEADRYALGALMCARLFGEHAFRRPEVLAALRPAQVRARLDELSNGLRARQSGDSDMDPGPSSLDSPAWSPTLRLVTRLLDPRPKSRPDDPVALLRALQSLRAFAKAGSLAGGLTQWWVPRRWPLFGELAPRLEAIARAWTQGQGPRLLVVYGPHGSGRGRAVRELAAKLQGLGQDVHTLDAEGLDAGAPGQWLGRWLGESEQALSGEVADAGPRLCVKAPHWPSRFDGAAADPSAAQDRVALRLAVLRAGAQLGRHPLVLVVGEALGRALAQFEDAQLATLEIRPLNAEQVREQVYAVVEGPEREAFARVAHSLSEGWPAGLVRCLRAAARADLQRADAAQWRRALEDQAPPMDRELARRVMWRAWKLRPVDLPAGYTLQMPTGSESTAPPLAWVLRAARHALGEALADMARVCATTLDGRGEAWPLSLALELDDASQVERSLEALSAQLPLSKGQGRIQGRTQGQLAQAFSECASWIEAREDGAPSQFSLRARVAAALLDQGEPARAEALLVVHETAVDSGTHARQILLARCALRRGEAQLALERLGELDAVDLNEAAAWQLEGLALRMRALVDLGDSAAAQQWEQELYAAAPTAPAGAPDGSDMFDVDSERARAWASAAAWAGYVCMQRGDASGQARAQHWLDAAVECAQQLGSSTAVASVRARALQLRGNWHALHGDTRASRHDASRAARAFRAAQEEGAALWLEANLAATALASGELGLALSSGRSSVRALMGRGELQSLSVVLWNTCEALAQVGAHEEAVQLCHASSQLLKAGGAALVEQARVRACQALASLRASSSGAGLPPADQARAEVVELEAAIEDLHACDAVREAVAMACARAGYARVQRDGVAASVWLQRAREWSAGNGDAQLELECVIESVELARAFGSDAALRVATDALASREECAHAAARGERMLAWKIDRALFRAVLKLHGPHHRALVQLRRRALNSLEKIMKETPSPEDSAAKEALVTEFGQRGPLEDLLTELVERGAGPTKGGVDTEPAHAAGTRPAKGPARAQPEQEPRAMRLLKMYRRLAREDDLERLLGQVCDAMMELTDAERGVVVVRSGETRLELSREFSQGEGREPNFSKSIIEKVLDSGAPLLSVDAREDDRFDQSQSISHLNLRSVVAVPLRFRGEVLGAAYVDHRLRRGAFAEEDLSLMEDFAELAGLAVANARALHEAREQAQSLVREQSELSSLLDLRDAEVQGLRETLRQRRDDTQAYRGMVGGSPAMQKLYRLVDRLSDSNVPVVIYGESGTGKELVARALHEAGARAKEAFVAENCGAIPETLLESVFFGHARGAFTGANHARAGLFEAAAGGTIFLDEIGEMSMAMQTKLLRVLQEGEVRRVGENKVRKVDVRIVAASNKDLQALVEAGGFRRDLFYRINVVRLEVPPLRDRREDIFALVEHFLGRYEAGALEVSASAKRQLLRYPWPGNVRELENEVQRWVALVEDRVRPDDLAAAISGADAAVDDPDDLRIKPRVESLERALITRALERSSGNQTHAAELLGLSRYGLQKKLKRFESGKDASSKEQDPVGA